MTHRIDIPENWQRRGLVLSGEDSPWNCVVMGDPCIVRDEEAGLWRMFLFALPPGHGQALCHGDPLDPGAWRFEGPLQFTNAQLIAERGAFKPFVVMDAETPGRAARFGDLFALLLVTNHENKEVRRAWSHRLGGPWTLEASALIERGRGGDYDARHVDAVSAWVLPGGGEILYFSMGYPLHAQDHPASPFGSSQGAALETVAAAAAIGAATRAGRPSPPSSLRKLGPLLPPAGVPGHWASGWVGGLQLLRGRRHRWLALVNASPTAPRPEDESISREEPPPSLGGFAVCDEDVPLSGWRWCDRPIEHLADVPREAAEAGERGNFWRHHALVTDDGRIGLFYNAGDYFQEKLFLKVAADDAKS